MKLLLLVIALGFTGAAPLEDDKACEPHSRPWQVRLHGGGASCSGALINEWWLVTSSYSCNIRPYDTIASLGEHDLGVQEGTEQHIRVAQVIQHSPYRSPLHSLTMVRLSAPARLNPFVQPLLLPTRCPQPGETCTVSGWGHTSRSSYFSSQLKCISVPVVDDQTCESTFPWEHHYWSPTMLCAGRYDTDNCLTDSGGVMECGGQLQGLSWLRRGCSDPSQTGVYTKLCRYNGWIASVMDRYTPFTTTALPRTTSPVVGSSQ